MLNAPDLSLLVAAVVGSLLWQAGTAAEEHSPLYRRLESTAVKGVMRTRPVRVPSWLSVSRFRSEHPSLGPDVFIVTTQDGYGAAVATVEELRRVPDEAARYTSVGQVAQPLSYVDGLRLDDPVLEAFLRFWQSNDVFLPVLDGREKLTGIVTAQDLYGWLHHNGRNQRRVLDAGAGLSSQMPEEKLAA